MESCYQLVWSLCLHNFPKGPVRRAKPEFTRDAGMSEPYIIHNLQDECEQLLQLVEHRNVTTITKLNTAKFLRNIRTPVLDEEPESHAALMTFAKANARK